MTLSRRFAGEREAFLDELHMDAALCQPQDYAAQIVKVPGHPVHAVADNCVPFPGERQQGFELRPLYVFTRGLVGEYSLDLDTF